MKNLDIIYPAYINAPIGPTSNLRRLIESSDKIKGHGYNLRVFTLEFLLDEPIGDVSIPMPNKNRNLIGNVKSMIRKSRFLSQLFLYFYSDKNSRKLVHKYLSTYNDGDIVVFEESGTSYHFLKNSKHLADIKTVLFHHSNGKRWDMMIKSWPKIKNSLYYNIFNKRLDFVDDKVNMNIFITKVGLLNFQKEHPDYDNSKLCFFHNGIENKEISKPEISTPPYRLITVGSVIERKGQRHIVEALAKLNEDRLKLFHLDIIGSGNDLEHIKHLIDKNKLQDNVTLHGSLPPKDVNNYLAQANVYMLMSNNEGLPISIIEGMRAGLPIISTPIAGIPEQVDDRNGLLISPSPESIVKIFNKMEDYNWEELGYSSRKRFEEEFTFDIMLKNYIDMLNTINK